MRIIQADEAMSPELRDALDTWIEIGDMEPILEKWINDAPPLLTERRVYRLEHWNRGAKAVKEAAIGHVWQLNQSACGTLRAFKKMVEELEEPAYEACGFYVTLPAGHSWGRDIRHSDSRNEFNVQEEFLMRRGVKVRIAQITEMEVDYMDDVIKICHGTAFL